MKIVKRGLNYYFYGLLFYHLVSLIVKMKTHPHSEYLIIIVI